MSNLQIVIPLNSRVLVVVLFLALGLGTWTSSFGQRRSNEVRELPLARTIERAMSDSETHRYKMDLKANEFFQVRVEQKGRDVILKLMDANGHVLVTMDSPNDKWGPETLSFVATKSGSYILEVGGFDKKAEKGTYTIQRGTSRTATALDKRRVEVEGLFVAGLGAEEIEAAIAKLDQAAAGWQDLADRYLRDLTVMQSKRFKAKKSYDDAIVLLGEETVEASRGALAKFQEANGLYRETGEKRGEGESLFYLALVSNDLGETVAALKFYGEALSRFRVLKDKSWEATTLNNIGNVYHHLNDIQKALDYYNQSLPLLKALDEKVEEVTTLNSIGAVYASLDQPQKALEYLNQALAVAKGAKDKAAEAKTLNNLGSLYVALKEYQKAIDYYNQALQLRQALGDKNGEATTLRNIAVAKEEEESQAPPTNPPLPVGSTIERQLNSRNKGDTYRVELKQGQFLRVDVEEKGVDVGLMLFRVRDNQIINSIDLGNGFERETLFYRVEETGDYRVFVSLSRSWSGRTYRLMSEIKEVAGPADDERIKALALLQEALASNRQGATAGFQEAIAKWEIARTSWKKLGEKFWEGYTEAYLGVTYFRLGEGGKAFDHYNQSLTLHRAVGDSYGEALAVSNIGTVFHLLGEKREALKYYTLALPLFKVVDSKKDEAILLSKIGSTYLELDQPQETLKYYAQALQVFKAIGSKVDEAIVLSNMGTLYHTSGDKQKALRYYNESLSIEREMGNNRSEAKLLNNIALVLEDEGNILTTFGFFTQSLRLAKTSGNKEAEAMILHNMMRAWLKAGGSRRNAILFGKQSVNKYEELRGAVQGLDNEVQKSFLSIIKVSYQNLVELLIMEGQLEQAVRVLNLYQDQQFFDFEREANAPVAQVALSPREQKFVTPYEHAGDRIREIRTQIDDLDQQLGDRQPNEQESAQKKRFDADLTAALDAFLTFILDVDKEFTKPLDEADKLPTGPDVADMQSALRELGIATKQKPAALYTLIGSGTAKFYVLLITPDEIKVFESSVEPDDLKKKVLQFYALLHTPDYDPRVLGEELYRIIFKPVEGELKKIGAQTLMWSLDSSLRYLPMAALWDGERYLVERYDHVVFTRANRERMTRNVSQSWTGTGFGASQEQVVALPAGGNLRFPALPGVSEELQSIFRTNGKGTGILNGEVFSDAKFTNRTFYEAMRERRPLVHISSHFSLRPGDESLSFLVLGDGKVVTLAEMKKQKGLFRDVELLTLSACDTAAQLPDDNGREIDGFAELAQRLGAGSVLATLWKVRDRSTALLMISFYRHRQLEKLNKAAALRRSQLDLLYGRNGAVLVSESTQSKTSSKGGLDTEDIVVETKYRIPFKVDKEKPFAHPYYWSPFVLFGNWK